MRLDDLKPFYNQVFRLTELENHFREDPASIKVQISRLAKRGKIIRLKKNCYTFPDLHPSPLILAQEMVEPSYHSLEWVLSRNSIIPEGVTSFSLITSKKTQEHRNQFGNFSYRHLPPNLFFGVDRREDGACIATKEKALLDYLYLNSAKFKADFTCFQSERFDELENLNWQKITKWAKEYNMKKLEKLSQCLLAYSKSTAYQDHR